MTKDRVLSELHALIDTRLFGDQWLVTHETAHVVDQRLTKLGLSEKVPGAVGQSQNTALGKEVNLHLMMVFIGTWHPWEMISILQGNDLINQREYDLLVDRIVDGGAGPEVVLIPFARRAYQEFFNPSRLLN